MTGSESQRLAARNAIKHPAAHDGPVSPARTVRQVAEAWQVSERFVYDLVAQGKLGHIRIGTLIRVRQADMDAYEAQAWHVPAPSTQPTASSTGAVVGGRMGRRNMFQLGQAIAAKRRDDPKFKR